MIALLVAGCVTETGNPDLDVPPLDIAVVARTSAPERVVVGDGPADGLRITEAFVTIRELRFERAEDCASGGTDEGEIEGLWTVDLVNVEPRPLDLPDGGYCRVRLRLDRAEGGDLDDRSIVLHGERADAVPFTVESRDNRELELRSDGEPFRLDALRGGLLLAFDTAVWLGDVGIEALEPDGGEIRVDEDTNDAALDRFESAVEDSLELFDDGDGNHAVEDDANPLAEGR